MRSLRDADLASSRGSLLLVVWLVEREARPAGVLVVVVVTVWDEEEEEEEEDMGGSNEEGRALEDTGLESEGPSGL